MAQNAHATQTELAIQAQTGIKITFNPRIVISPEPHVTQTELTVQAQPGPNITYTYNPNIVYSPTISPTYTDNSVITLTQSVHQTPEPAILRSVISESESDRKKIEETEIQERTLILNNPHPVNPALLPENRLVLLSQQAVAATAVTAQPTAEQFTDVSAQ